MNIVSYLDIDWAGSCIDKKSTIDYYTFIGEN